MIEHPPASRPRACLPATVWSVALVTLLGACSFNPEPIEVAPLERIPERFSTADAPGAARATAWWSTFGDPTLDRLVTDAIASNLDLREAVGRIEEVRAQYRIARSALFPSAQVGVDFSRIDQPANSGQFGAIFGGDEGGSPLGDGPDRFSFETFGASLGLSYELDFWGRVRNGRNAAMADALATASDFETVRISVAAETIAAYFELRELTARQRIRQEQVDLLSERLTLTDDRYRRGVVTSLELYQIQQDLNASRALLPLLGSQITATRGRLAVLLGRYPHELDETSVDGAAPEVRMDAIPAGLPSALLQNRPDLRSAALRLEAARQRVGERAAARWPSILLTGSAGQQSSELSNLLRPGQFFTSFVTSLTAPIFSGGRLKADQEVAQARYEQEAARYATAVLTAFQEVDAGLALFNAQRERKLILDDQLVAAQASADNQLRRLDLGIGDYVAYLDALRTTLNVEDTRATSERELAEARLGVHRALGGSWIEETPES
ncbi:MAG: TolC family protein [Gemmatimonadota bacterium]|nr:TolC family protein [Gemmatimonadota bacterium]